MKIPLYEVEFTVGGASASYETTPVGNYISVHVLGVDRIVITRIDPLEHRDE